MFNLFKIMNTLGLQSVSNTRDLNPHQVETNHLITNCLSMVYRRWGYIEIESPRIEHIDTLRAGGAINSKEIVKLVADEPLGLRPEMTASIARAATTRMANRERPLRLWASGTVYKSKVDCDGNECGKFFAS